MSENFELHLLKCLYSECYCNQNLTVSKSRKLRGPYTLFFLKKSQSLNKPVTAKRIKHNYSV